ncbi:hypothetical protein [Hymenobacter sp.]|uniref:hypothetical protein n=1 Tax=Hymenobacter sp. TaxID=1898978 RepID=UPI00286C0FA3|nr:hypothetical protein [Hymenobacter sp.]
MVCRAADRLSSLCLALHLSTAEFAALLDLPPRRARRVLKPTHRPSLKLMARVQRAIPQVNPHWLLCGEGEMLSRPLDPQPSNTGNWVGTNYGTVHQTIQTIVFCGPPPCSYLISCP